MKKRHLFTCVLICSATVIVGGCGGGNVKRALGLKKHTPDEFMVLSRPPLAVPPDFSLPAPSETAARPQSQVRDEAKKVLFKNEPSSAKKGSLNKAEVGLLNQAGADGSNPNIRDLIDSEYSDAHATPEEEKGILESLIEPITPAKKDPLVDIDKEEDRLSKNKEEGKPVNEGDVPVQESKSKGIINDLLGL